MTNSEDYFSYLARRSWKGKLYRERWLYPKVARHLKGKVLDVGCGIGDMLTFLSDATGVDVNPQAVSYCKSRGLNALVMEVDMLPFADASFNSILLDNVIEHIDAPLPLLTEIRRTLHASGRLVVGVPGSKGFLRDPDHKVFYDKDKLDTCLSAAGFEPETHFYTPFESSWLERKLSSYCLYCVYVPVNCLVETTSGKYLAKQ